MKPNHAASYDTPGIIFVSRNGVDRYGKNNLTITKCTSRTTYVDANVTCISRGASGKAICGVGALRETPEPPENPNTSLLDYRDDALLQFDAFSGSLGDRFTFVQSSTVEFYMADPLTGLIRPDNVLGSGYTNLGELDIGTFEKRFSLLWNTLWKVLWAGKSTIGGNMSTLDFEGWSIQTLQNTTSHLSFPLPPTYAVSSVWLALYFVSVSVMLSAAIFSWIVRSQCRAPSILGYVSSLIRDSTYFEDYGVNTSSVEDGVEKSRRLRGLKVMIADVGNGMKNANKIAFAPVGVGGRVKEGKLYY